MAKIRIPSFLTKLDQAEKTDMMKQLKSWKAWAVSEYLVQHLESKLDRLIIEDEKEDFLSKFQTNSHKAKRLGRRQELRELLKDLK